MFKQHKDAVELTITGRNCVDEERESVEKLSRRELYLLELSSILSESPYQEVTSKPNRLLSIYNFFDATDFRRNLGGVLLMLVFLLIGIIATMITEGWDVLKAAYFCTFALLTVGHGDIVPTTDAGVWFTVFYIPGNIVFLSLYLLLVSRFYSFVQKMNVRRIEQNMKKSKQGQKEEIQSTKEDKGESQSDHGSSQEAKVKRRKRIKQLSINSLMFSGQNVSTAQDMFSVLGGLSLSLHFDLTEMSEETKASVNGICDVLKQVLPTDFHDFLSEWPKNVLFLKRLSAIRSLCTILPAELRNFQSEIEIQSDTVLRFSIEGMEHWKQKWSIPPYLWPLFRELVVETLFYVGEDNIRTKGEKAFLELSAIEVLELYSPFVLQFTRIENLETWLEQIREPLERARKAVPLTSANESTRHTRPIIDNQIMRFFPANPGNAIRSQLVSSME